MIARSLSLLYTIWCGSDGHASILYIHLIAVVVDKSSSLKSELLASEATFTGKILTGNPIGDFRLLIIIELPCKGLPAVNTHPAKQRSSPCKIR